MSGHASLVPGPQRSPHDPPLARPAESQPLGLAGDAEVGGAHATSEIAVLGAGFYSAQLLVFVAGFAQKGLLGPAGTGYWALMATLWPFMSLTSAGALRALERTVPAERARREFSSAAAAANTGATFTLLAIGLMGAAMAVFAVIAGGAWAPELRWGIVLLGVTAPLRIAVDIHQILLRATRRFGAISTGFMANALTTLTLQTCAVAAIGFYGMFVGVVAAAITTLVLWRCMGLTGRGRPAFRLSLRRDMLRGLVRVGMPILIYSQVWLLFTAVDTLVVAAALSVGALGAYALAVSVNTYILFLPKVVSSVLFTRTQEMVGVTNDVRTLGPLGVAVPRVLGGIFVPGALTCAFFLLPLLVRFALPSFDQAIPAIRVMVGGAFFLALIDLPVTIGVSGARAWRMSALMIACLALNAGLNVCATVILHWGVIGAALATSLSYYMLFVAVTMYGLGQATGARAAARQVRALTANGLYVLGALWLTHLVMPSPHGLVLAGLTSCASIGVVALCVAPVAVAVERQYDPAHRLRGLLGAAAARVVSPWRRVTAN